MPLMVQESLIKNVKYFCPLHQRCSKKLHFHQRFFIVLYADDILILAPTVSELQRLLRECEQELAWLDMVILY